MAITTSVANSFKKELFQALHDFTASTGHVFKGALYTSAATLSSATTVYSATNEAAATGYTAGGATLSSSTPVLSGSTVILDFADVTWTITGTLTAHGFGIYNTNAAANRWVAVWDFGSDVSVTNGTYQVIFPTPDAANAILRL